MINEEFKNIEQQINHRIIAGKKLITLGKTKTISDISIGTSMHFLIVFKFAERG